MLMEVVLVGSMGGNQVQEKKLDWKGPLVTYSLVGAADLASTEYAKSRGLREVNGFMVNDMYLKKIAGTGVLVAVDIGLQKYKSKKAASRFRNGVKGIYGAVLGWNIAKILQHKIK